MSLGRLNELLARALDDMAREGLTIITKDDKTFKPWLPASYWAAEAVANKMIEEFRVTSSRKAARATEDAWLAANASVADVLERDIPRLQGDDERMINAGWGLTTMRQTLKQPQRATSGSMQPSFDFECYQCGRPITAEGKDHAGRHDCDHALLDQETIDAQDYWETHQAKPVHGEEVSVED
jgi:hypothetical protein